MCWYLCKFLLYAYLYTKNHCIRPQIAYLSQSLVVHIHVVLCTHVLLG